MSLESAKAFSESRTSKGSSEPSEPLVACDSLISLPLTQPSTFPKSKSKKIQKSSCTPESLLPSKKTISKGKKSSSPPMYLTNIRDPNKSKSPILDPASTSRGPDFYEFWDPLKKETYQQLSWLPKIDWQDLDLNLSSGSAQNTELKSWFSILKTQPQNPSLEKTSWPSFKFTVVDRMEKEDTESPTKIVKAFKLCLKPSKKQKELLNSWAGCSRFLYNKTVAMLTNPKNKTLKEKLRLRNRFVTVQKRQSNLPNSFYNNKKWLLDCPSKNNSCRSSL